MKKSVFIGLGTITTLSCIAISLSMIRASRPSISSVKATDHTITLDNSVATGATSSFGDGNFTVQTESGNDVDFEYKYAKSSESGLIALGNTLYENPDDTNFYIGNTDPITSVSSITVNFQADTTLFLFASYDGIEFYKVDVLTESGAVTSGNPYFYFRFVNANSGADPLNITSIVFQYACVETDYTDELSDLTSGSIIRAGEKAEEAITNDDTNFSGDLNSSHSVRISSVEGAPDDSSNMYKYSFSIPLPRAFTIKELKNVAISFDYSSENNAQFNSGHNFFRLYFYFSVSGYSHIKTGESKDVNISTGNLANETGWHTLSLSLGEATLIGDLDETTAVSYLYVRPAYVNGFVNIDQMRMGFIRNYPEYSIPADMVKSGSISLNKDDNVGDLLNTTVTNAEDSGHGSGVRITANSDIKEYSRIGSIVLDRVYNFDLCKQNAGTISFWANYAGATCTSGDRLFILQFCKDGSGSSHRASDEVKFNAAAVTLDTSDSANSWVKVTVDMSKVTNTGAAIEQFDRINIKLEGTSHCSLNSGNYFEIASLTYSGLVIQK